MYRYMIIYKKRNDELIYRMIKTFPTYHKGDKTSMGWKVVDILKVKNGKIHTTEQYNLLSSLKNKLSKIFDIVLKVNLLKLAEISFFIYLFKKIM